MSTTNFSSGRSHTKSFQELPCSPFSMGGLQQQPSIFFSAVHILLSITAFAGNFLILVALHKESSLHPPSKLLYRCLATTDLLVGLVAQPLYALSRMSVVQEHRSLCRYVRDATYITAYVLILVSLMTMTALSVDRLLALLLGLRYKQIVTLKRTYIIVTTFWVFNFVASLSKLFHHRIADWYGFLVISFCLVISVASYTKIFCTLRYHQAQVRDQQQLSQTNALNMARFRKAVYSALWVQLVLVVCYVPGYTVGIVIPHTKNYSSLLVVTWSVTGTLLYFNSTLNPFLYCWKINEVRKAVKQTLKEALC
ncbi:adrenocorticotropic hormone receptor-like [Pocillopora verrucosa]|uniref:adrenocorticotropic hormone receptor-like n=1 Tax=Pocillopora verrucosa TaxID=203993 RepID=UPI0033411338